MSNEDFKEFLFSERFLVLVRKLSSLSQGVPVALSQEEADALNFLDGDDNPIDKFIEEAEKHVKETQ